MRKTIKESIVINAPKEKVWDVLFSDKSYRTWASEFMEGSYVETDWKQGSKARFIDPNSNSGVYGWIVDVKPHQFMKIQYDGIIEGGKEDSQSEGAREMKGGVETYTLAEKNRGVELSVASDMGEQWFDEMSEAWERALGKIKELSEAR